MARVTPELVMAKAHACDVCDAPTRETASCSARFAKWPRPSREQRMMRSTSKRHSWRHDIAISALRELSIAQVTCFACAEIAQEFQRLLCAQAGMTSQAAVMMRDQLSKARCFEKGCSCTWGELNTSQSTRAPMGGTMGCCALPHLSWRAPLCAKNLTPVPHPSEHELCSITGMRLAVSARK